MRLTEYFHFLKRDDIGMAQNPKERDYTHFRPNVFHKRQRYYYQCMIKGKKPVK
jgi:hypothetical protein